MQTGDSGVVLLVEQPSAPSTTTDTGKLYVKSSDSHLYFKDSDGTEHDLLGAATGDMLASTYDPAGISEQLVGLVAAQTLTNKDLSSGTNTFPTFNQDTTGNAATATALATARTIAGVSFDGTANISITAADVSAIPSSDAPAGAIVGTTDVQSLTHKDLTDSSNTFPTFNQDTTGNAATATVLATARDIDGQSFDGSADITVVAPATHAATSKTTPIDDDELPVTDSAASYVLKKLTWSNLKATLKTYFDTLYQSTGTYLGGSTGSTDNAVLRADGTTGAIVQSSDVTIDDSGNISAAGLTVDPGGTGDTTIIMESGGTTAHWQIVGYDANGYLEYYNYTNNKNPFAVAPNAPTYSLIIGSSYVQTSISFLATNSSNAGLIMANSSLKNYYTNQDLIIGGSGTVQLQTYNGSWGTRLTVLNNGEVGIGVSPSYMLDVNGDVNIASGSSFKIGGTDIASTDLSDTASIMLIAATQTVTNKDLSSSTNTFPTFNQDTTGNAATATALATARTIAGVSFDGSANITLDIDDLSDVDTSTTAPTDGQVLMWVAADSKWEPKTTSGSGDMLASTYDPNSVAADAFDMDNMVQGSTNKFVTAAELTVLGNTSGTNTGDQTSVTGNAGTATKLATARTIDGQSFDGSANITVIAPGAHAATSKTIPVDADELPLVDSAASNVLKKLTWSNLKATLKTYFDSLYQGSLTLTTTGTSGAATLSDGTLNIPQYSSGSGGSPGGSDTQVQYNSSGSFAGDSALTYASSILTIDGTQIGKVDGTNQGIIFTEEGGTVSITGSDAVSPNTAGTVLEMIGGTGNGSGDGGSISNVGGFGGATGDGGGVVFTGGYGGSTSGNGGDITFTPGGVFGTGTVGHVNFRDPSSFIAAVLDTSSLSTANKTFTFPDATGTFVLLDATQTMSNKTLTAPKFADLGYLADTSGNEVVRLDTVGSSAVNQLDISNNSTGLAPFIRASGDDTNISLNLLGKGTGIVYANSDPIVTTTATQTLTNKDLSSGTNTFPTFNQNTTGSAAKLTTARTILVNLASTSSASFDGSGNVTPGIENTLPVGHGGTGATTLTGILKGNGTGAVTAVTAPSGTIMGTSDSQTVTNKRNEPRTSSTTSTSTLTMSKATADTYYLTAQAAALTIAAPTGTPVQGEVMSLYITDNGTSQTLTFNSVFKPFGAALPTATTAGKTLMVVIQYDGTNWSTLTSIEQ